MIIFGDILAILTIIIFSIVSICVPLIQDKSKKYPTLLIIVTTLVMLLPVGTGLMYLCK